MTWVGIGDRIGGLLGHYLGRAIGALTGFVLVVAYIMLVIPPLLTLRFIDWCVGSPVTRLLRLGWRLLRRAIASSAEVGGLDSPARKGRCRG
jgi:hypothetical protein